MSLSKKKIDTKFQNTYIYLICVKVNMRCMTTIFGWGGDVMSIAQILISSIGFLAILKAII